MDEIVAKIGMKGEEETMKVIAEKILANTEKSDPEALLNLCISKEVSIRSVHDPPSHSSGARCLCRRDRKSRP